VAAFASVAAAVTAGGCCVAAAAAAAVLKVCYKIIDHKWSE